MNRLAYAWFHSIAATACAFALVAACGGDNGGSSPDGGETPDAGDPPDAGETPDAGMEVQTVNVTGSVVDYFNPVSPIASAQLSTEGVVPALDATTLGDGSYTLTGVPVGSSFFVDISAPQLDTYRITRNEPVATLDADVIANFQLVANADVDRQHSQVPDGDGNVILPDPEASFVIVDLRRNNGMPLLDVPAAQIYLDDMANPIGVGPYFFGPLGDIQPTGPDDVSQAHGGKARAAFLNVPAGEHTLYVDYQTNQGQPRQFAIPFVATANGAILLRTGGQGDGGMMMDVTFEAHIYPMLQTAANGGEGCANCHTAGGQAGGLIQFDLPAMEVHNNLISNTDALGTPYVNLGDPPASALLTNPLYENPPDHPNATFLTTEDPRYQMIMMWIQQGGNL